MREKMSKLELGYDVVSCNRRIAGWAQSDTSSTGSFTDYFTDYFTDNLTDNLRIVLHAELQSAPPADQ